MHPMLGGAFYQKVNWPFGTASPPALVPWWLQQQSRYPQPPYQLSPYASTTSWCMYLSYNIPPTTKTKTKKKSSKADLLL
eukprot:scaffold421230_cov61-Attheya_sp.AAC.2